ncbi:MAG: pseudaminic acid biosynthesis-associated methylase [Thermacetogeniaceae bacterium]|jgi:spore coat polysaccharide biosynthesis protein SpsF
MVDFDTEQERFWFGEFGDSYTDRNKGNELICGNISLLSSIFKHTGSVDSLIEFGSNRGLNLMAIRSLLPTIELAAVEINPKAISMLQKLDIPVYQESILNFTPDYPRDFVLSKGLLIHINPEMLSRAYDVLYESSRKYICLVEYYSRVPVEIEYRGHKGVLFKRDFAGELMDRFHDLELISYGFVYYRDRHFPQDDPTWFLLEKKLNQQ